MEKKMNSVYLNTSITDNTKKVTLNGSLFNASTLTLLNKNRTSLPINFPKTTKQTIKHTTTVNVVQSLKNESHFFRSNPIVLRGINTNTPKSQKKFNDYYSANSNQFIIQMNGKSPMEQLVDIHAKATSSRNRNEEAIHDLKTRIPEIQNIFDIHSRIGNGTFSTVFLGTLKKERGTIEEQQRKFAIKHHIPTSHPDRIMKELQCMAKIGGIDNVVGINCCIRYNESVAFIMPYLAHDRFHDFYNKMEIKEIQFYLKNLLIALRHVHKFNVIHRDVKPSNFLYNRRTGQFLLVDFGLAQQVPACLSHSADINRNLANPKFFPNLLHSNIRCDGKSCRKLNGKHTIGNIPLEYRKVMSTTKLSRAAKRLRFYGPEDDEQIFTKTECQSNNMACTNYGIIATRHGSHSKKTLMRSLQKVRAMGGADVTSKNFSKINTEDIAGKIYMKQKVDHVSQCHCYANPQICNICMMKKEIHASRAGTPGYRPPEVLLKYPDQTTAVDVWAVGVIFLSLLSSVYPFFKAPNDFVALAEMVTIFGDKIIRKTAYLLDRLITLSQKTKPLDLRKLCVRFRNRAKFSSPDLLKKHKRLDGTCEICRNCDQFFFNCLCMDTDYNIESYADDDPFPTSAYDLLYKLLNVNPHKRITAKEALMHSFFTEDIQSFHEKKIKDSTNFMSHKYDATIIS